MMETTDNSLSTIVFFDYGNMRCMGKYFSSNLDIIAESIVKAIGETPERCKIIVVVMEAPDITLYLNWLADWQNVDYIFIQNRKFNRGEDDQIIRQMIMQYAEDPNVSNLVLSSNDNGYYDCLAFAESKGKNVFVVCNHDQGKTLRVFRRIRLNNLRKVIGCNNQTYNRPETSQLTLKIICNVEDGDIGSFILPQIRNLYDELATMRCDCIDKLKKYFIKRPQQNIESERFQITLKLTCEVQEGETDSSVIPTIKDILSKLEK